MKRWYNNHNLYSYIYSAAKGKLQIFQNLMLQSKFPINLQCVKHAALFMDLKILSNVEVEETVKASTNFLHKILLRLGYPLHNIR